MKLRVLPTISAASWLMLMVGCGGGGSGSPPPPPPPAPLVIVTTNAPNGLIGTAYTATLQATGGTGQLNWSATTSLPIGLSLDSTGKVTGIPTDSGNFGFGVHIQDSGTPRQTADGQVIILITTPLKFDNTPTNANRGVNYSWRAVTEGGVGAPTFSLTVGTLPPGLTLDTSGNITGVPTQAGSFNFTLQANSAGPPLQTLSADFTLVVDSLVAIVTANLGEAVEGRAFSATLQSVNGTAPLHWSSDPLPAGLTLNASTGAITGTPTTFGSYGSIFTVKDSSSPVQTFSKFIDGVIWGKLILTSSNLGNVTVSGFGAFPIPYSGGKQPITFNLISGTLPPGMSINFGAISGFPTTLGTYSFVVQAQDALSPPQTAQGTLTISVVPPPPVIKIASLPNAIVGRPYQAGLAATNGTPPYHWSISSGSLPTGILLDSAGLLHGSPTAAGSAVFSVRLTDSGAPAQSVTTPLTINVRAAALGRNDSIGTATPLTNGSYIATISPYSHPSTTGPDGDFYRLTANPFGTVSVTIFAARMFPSSELDPVVEILDGSGTRLSTCKDPASAFLRPPLVPDPNPNDFNDACINDDDPGSGTTDSSLAFQVPGTAGGPPVTFYVHVLDWRGDARPDLRYQILVSGAN